jgi:UPF0271 protein
VTTIDLNCDMGESFGAYTIGDDNAMMEVISTANIACGFHAGDPVVMRDTIIAAKARGVAIGAHPSFMDLYGFGRRRISGERSEDLEAQIIYQIAAMQGMAAALSWPMTHVKTHGSLGNMAAVDAELAGVCVRAIRAVDPGLVFITLPYSQTMKAAEAAGLRVACEVYADRTYDDAGMLTSRQMEGAVIHDPAHSVDQVLSRRLHSDHGRQEAAGRGRVDLRSRRQSGCGGDGPRPARLAGCPRHRYRSLRKTGRLIEEYS